MSQTLAKPKRGLLISILLPSLFIYSFIIVFPLLFSVFYSLLDWEGGMSSSFVGLENYRRVLHDSDFLLSIKNTVVITILNVLGQVGIGLIIATVLVNKYVLTGGIHRTVIFTPVVISPVVVGILWSIIYSNRSGILNLGLKALGVESPPLWLDDPGIVLYSVSIPIIWQYIGLYMVILLGALEGVPKSVLESAEIDGASGIHRLFAIMIPMIYPTFKVAILICISGTMKIFDQVYVLTGGGPGKSSMTMSQYNYIKSFNMMEFSYGSVISISMIIIIMGLSGVIMKLMGGSKYE